MIIPNKTAFHLFATFLFAFYTIFSNSQDVAKIPAPDWINGIKPNTNVTQENQGGFHYLLIDLQENPSKETLFRHYAIKITNADGIQAMSDVSVSFDPSYQRLNFHRLNLIRNGTVVEKLQQSKINLFQRETNMERSLYDGSYTAVINLSNVREGDILDYAYSIVGFNPINKGNYATTFYQEYTSPVNRIYTRLLVGNDLNLSYKLLQEAVEPKILKSSTYTEYLWDQDGLQNQLYDTNVPSWLDVQKRVSISTFSQWNDVVKWATQLYDYPSNDVNIAKDLMMEKEPKDEQIVQLIRFVQDEVRYLGLESGIGAYKPNNPSKVYVQRYGDCKDKSLLLVSALRKQSITSYPLLVNTQLRQEINKVQPSHNVFDHCIVYFEFEGEKYFVDPTTSNQGGNLENIIFPNYGMGLLIKPGENELITIPNNLTNGLEINETIKLDSIGGGAVLYIETEYFGQKANLIRKYFNSSSSELIEKDYLNFYSNLYPNIELANKIVINDGLRNSLNSVYVEENYKIDDFWTTTDEGIVYFEIYPIVLESLINYPVSAKRNMPYYLGEPFSFRQKTLVRMPEPWNVTSSEKKIDGEGFEYSNRIKGSGKEISLLYTYNLKREVTPANTVADLHKKNDLVKNDLSFLVSYDKSLEGFKISYLSISLLIIALIIGIFSGLSIYRNYNPVVDTPLAENSIGGWLILPAIGLLLTPIVILIQILQDDPFNRNTWTGLGNLSANSIELSVIYGAELFYNFMFIAFTILLLVLFFKKRSSLPKLIIIFYAMSFVIPILDLLLVETVAPDQLSSSDKAFSYKEIGRSFFRAVIWIPYFLVSKRVKSTFTRTYSDTSSNR